MKRRIITGLILAMILVLLSPTAALAAKPQAFHASGTITSISPGNVVPAGESGRFRIIERELTGTVSGDINGGFTMTYQGNVALATQAGNLHDTVVSGPYTLKIESKVQPLEMVDAGQWGYGHLPMMSLTGHWTMQKGGKGEGTLEAWAIFIPDEYGHVAYIIASSFTLTGQWQP